MPETFQPNSAGLARLARDFDLAGRRAADAIWQTLGRWGAEFHRRVKDATPVAPGGGALRASWLIAEERAGKQMSVTIGTSLRGKHGEPYALYLELGTARIAGGRVEVGQPGEPPIELSAVDRRGAERPASLAARQNAPVRLPIVRPIGEAIAPRVAADVQRAAANELSASLDGKHY
ncbi:MAG TPA: HK97 gp10 family phage protein [Pirellulales bacterium]|nr:HK97 gp10 family phage protein [Pirellulales bacterium]